MEAPKCKLCGERHWSRLCYEPRDDPVTKPVTRHTKRDDDFLTQARETLGHLSQVVTPKQADLEAENRKLRSEVARLETEVVKLKQDLAGRQEPLTDAERAKRYRERKKACPSS